jgi:hypothetical protein
MDVYLSLPFVAIARGAEIKVGLTGGDEKKYPQLVSKAQAIKTDVSAKCASTF